MKLISLILLFFTVSIISQEKLDGTFRMNGHKEYVWPFYDVYKFYNDSLFVYAMMTDHGNYYGEGVYTIDNDKLTLKFDSVSLEKNYKVIYKDSTDLDSVITMFTIFDGYNKPLSDVNCYLKDSSGYSQDSASGNFKKSGPKGNVFFSLEKTKIPANILFAKKDYQSLELTLKDTLSRVIEIYLFKGRKIDQFIYKGTTKKLKIKIVCDKKFILGKKRDSEYQYSDDEFDIDEFKY